MKLADIGILSQRSAEFVRLTLRVEASNVDEVMSTQREKFEALTPEHRETLLTLLRDGTELDAAFEIAVNV